MLRIAHISTFPPTRCGIAEYSQDLIANLTEVESHRFRLNYSGNPVPGFDMTVNIGEEKDFIELADAVDPCKFDVINLQHEFGIWGGREGEYLRSFLRNCKTPIVATLHTTFGRGRSELQLTMLRELCLRSQRIVVLSKMSQATIQRICPDASDRVSIIRHGVPNVAFIEPDQSTLRPPPFRRVVFVSPGFMRPDKGIETIIDALAEVMQASDDFEYWIVGDAQPQFDGQREYLAKVRSRIVEKNLLKNVKLITGFLQRQQQVDYIQAADCGIIGYQDITHSSSGVIPLILACGRPVIATPIEYVRAIESEVRGVFVTAGFDAVSLRDRIANVINNKHDLTTVMHATFQSTRDWVWPTVAKQYRKIFEFAATRPVTFL